MWKLVTSRLLMAVPMVAIVAAIVFGLFTFVPIDPVQVMYPDGISESQAAAVRDSLGLNDPFLVRFGSWFLHAAEGNFGHSYLTGNSVLFEIGNRLPLTLALAAGGLVMAVVIGIPIGVFAALKPNSLFDRASTIVVSIFLAAPGFWIALLLLIYFAGRLGWFPVSGYKPFAESPIESIRAMVLPWIAIGIGSSAVIARQCRASVIEQLDAPYVRALTARGLSKSRVVKSFVMKNAMVPVLATIGVQASIAIGITFVVEQIFSIPGLSMFLIGAIFSGDVPILQGSVVLIAIIVVFVNLLVDIGYGLLDPKARPQ